MNGSVAPAGYAELLAAVKEQVRTARLRAHRVVNTELLQLYWAIGHVILERQAAEGWGTARRANGESPTQIAKALGVSRASAYRHLPVVRPN